MSNRKKTIQAAILATALLASAAAAQYDMAQTSGDLALPVLLTGFAAQGGTNSVQLQWSTASESELAGFNLYRSLGQQGAFQRINPVIIPAQGAGSQGRQYQFHDENLIPGFHYYYKLATVEVTGQELTLEPAVLGIAGHAQGNSWAQPPDYNQLTYLRLEGNHPDPFNGETTITFSVFEAGWVRLDVYALDGRRVHTLRHEFLSPGQYSQAFRGDDLPSGVYLCRLTGTRGFDTVRKMVLLR
ncbi:MAG: T9SS C-terminal target domain-containing protein [Candidatus Zixiibacteriota bacterium]|nr:MAG: T9SS C-terminal target domain-containing protein [candidate division Zixibacteria bacterium]